MFITKILLRDLIQNMHHVNFLFSGSSRAILASMFNDVAGIGFMIRFFQGGFKCRIDTLFFSCCSEIS